MTKAFWIKRVLIPLDLVRLMALLRLLSKFCVQKSRCVSVLVVVLGVIVVQILFVCLMLRCMYYILDQEVGTINLRYASNLAGASARNQNTGTASS